MKIGKMILICTIPWDCKATVCANNSLVAAPIPVQFYNDVDMCQICWAMFGWIKI
jgi:hypothetical protein